MPSTLRNDIADALERFAVDVEACDRPKRGYSRVFRPGCIFRDAGHVIKQAFDAGLLENEAEVSSVYAAQGSKGLQVLVLGLATRSIRPDWKTDGYDLDAAFYRRMADMVRAGKARKSKSAASGAEQLESLLGDYGKEILELARRTDRTAEERMEAIERVDSRVKGFKSTRWSQLLGNVTPQAVRRTRPWKRWKAAEAD